MRSQLVALCAFGLAGVCIVGAIVLSALGKPIPSDLWTACFAALTGGAGIAIPTTG